MPDLSPYCKKCHKYAMWPNNECTCDDTPKQIVREPKTNPRFESIDDVLFTLKLKLIRATDQTKQTNPTQLELDRQKCIERCKRIEFVRNELLSMKHW